MRRDLAARQIEYSERPKTPSYAIQKKRHFPLSNLLPAYLASLIFHSLLGMKELQIL
jgi:hypothetical protein